jgi:hypothetical protein
MLEKQPARRPISPSHLIAEIETCMAVLKGETPLLAPADFQTPAPASPAPEFRKMTGARQPVSEAAPRQFLLAEILIGAAIAALIYLVLSRPIDSPPETPHNAAALATPPSAEPKMADTTAK